MTGLFTAQSLAPRRLSAYGISLSMHFLGLTAISYGLLYAPVIHDPTLRHYQVRHLNLHLPETPESRAAEALYPGQKKDGAKQGGSTAKADRPAEARMAAAASEPPKPQPILKLRDGGSGKQILLQPDQTVEKTIAIEAPVPTVLIWTPSLQDAKEIVPPKPEIATAADLSTAIEVPNEELKLAELPVRAVDKIPAVETPPAASSSPIAVTEQEPVKMAPATADVALSDPTPTAVLSVSDLRMEEGKAALPPVNETAGASKENGAAKPTEGTQAVSGLGVTRPAAAVAQSHVVEQSAAVRQQPGTQVAGAQSAAPADEVSSESADHIQFPKDGKFSVVVVGTSLSDRYPETLQVWSDRVAYTAYLHVGTPKAWILQYAQLRGAEAAGGGSLEHLDAPWPYDIVRPNLLARDVNGDALMVHGVLNEAGHLERLAITFPEGFPHASFVLNSLSKWQFRPALQGGKATAVEVLLIIPEEMD